MSETQQTEQLAEAEFVAGFNSLRTSDDYTPPEVKKDEVEPAPESTKATRLNGAL